MKACKQQKYASLHLDCPIIPTVILRSSRFKSPQHDGFAIVDGVPCPCWPPSPSAFPVSWKMSPAHWLNFIPSWPGPFCEGAINLALNTTFVYYSGKALMTFMSMITTFFSWGENAQGKAKIHCDQTHMSCTNNFICNCHVSFMKVYDTETYYWCYYYIDSFYLYYYY